MKKFCFAGFGEVMLRLSPPEKLRFNQSLPGLLRATFGGGEANVCASISQLGGYSRYLGALPNNPISRAFATQLAGIGVDVSQITYSSKGRMGVYFAEHGSNMRSSEVIYDRDISAISLLAPEDYDFDAMLNQVNHLHLTGITPALSRNAFESTLAIAKKAHQAGTKISIDLNYRKKLWNWSEEMSKEKLANYCMSQIVPLADIIIANEEDAYDIFGIMPNNSDIAAGKLNIGAYQDVAQQLSLKFSNAKFIAITLRQSISADHNNWGGMLYDCNTKQAHFAPCNSLGEYQPYEICNIVDRFGGGDSFAAGLLFALNSDCYSEAAQAIRFAVAASAIKHTIYGDYNYTAYHEVETLIAGDASGRVKR